MPAEQMLVRLLRDLAARQQRQNQVLTELIHKRLERILTLPERKRDKSMR